MTAPGWYPDPYTQALGLGVALAVTPGGDAFVLDFHDGTTGTHDAYVQHYTPGSPAGTWSPELVLSKPSGPARTLLRAIKADPEGLRKALAAA